MSIYSDYECGAMTEREFRNACARENNEDRYEREYGSYYKCPYTGSVCCGWECSECSVYLEEHTEDEESEEEG